MSDDDDGAFAPMMEQEIQRDELRLFRELVRQMFEDEMDDLRERRGEFGMDGAQEWANAAARACGIAAAYVLVRRDFEDAVCEKPVRPPRRKRRKKA